MSEHAYFSPSHAKTWASCMGALALSEGQPDTQSAAAEEGTFAHGVLERCILLGCTPAEAGARDDEMEEGVQSALDFLYAKASEMGGSIQSERKVYLNEECWGTCDITMVSPDRKWMGVYDFKYGKGVTVEVIDNWQLEIYAIGAMVDAQIDNDWTVEVGIMQPRIPHKDGVNRTTAYTPDQLRGRRSFFEDAMLNQTVGTNYSPSEEACRWCRAKGICKALAEKCLQDAALWFPAEESEPTRGTIEAHAVEKPGELDMAVRSAILSNVELIRAWLKSVEANSMDQALSGVHIPGFKVVLATGGNRRFDQDEDFLLKMFRGMKIKKADVTASKLLSPAQIEKVAKRLVKQEHISQRQFDRIMSHVVEAPKKKTLVPEADSREAVAITAEQMFG